MGNFKSRCRGTFGSKNHGDQTKIKSSIEQPFPNEIYGNWAEDLELKILRRTIEQNPELFILNNLMMSVQFFENYEEEITNVKQKLVSARESELNGRLPPQKHALIPDVLQEQVGRAIDFTYLRPTSIPSVEPLQPIRIYIVFDNIEVTEQNYASPYCSVNETITYSMQLKPSKHKGYALLQRLEVNPSKKKNYLSCDEAIYSDTDSLYDDRNTNPNDNLFVKCDKKSGGSGSSSLTSPSSDVNDEDSIYDEREHNAYGIDNEKPIKQINHIKKGTNMPRSRVQRTRQSPKITGHRNGTNSSSPPGSISSGYRSGNYAIDSGSEDGYGLAVPYNKSIDRKFLSSTSKFISEIPRQCFQIYDPVKEKRLRLNNKDRLIKGVIHSRKYDVWYMNSTKFMDYFYNIFTDQLSELMGFDPDIDDEPQGAFIYRDKFEVLKKTMVLKDDQFAIIPCIWSPWPNIADEWLERPRATWPDYDIIEKVKETGCYMIPEGYYDENSTNNLRNLEWELTFPAAERYLETCMSYSQVRIYLMALMLQKTFMRPMDSYVGLTGAHIRNQLFWLIEDNDTPSKWHDSHMGECLNMLLKSLYRAISQDVPIMPDYFIRDKNIFQNNISLLRTQKQLKRIIENPIMYLLHAMQNIKHSRSFFPKLDYTLLLKILTEDVLTLINPHLAAHQSQKSQSKTDNIQENQYDRGGFWDSAKQTKERNNIYSRKQITNKSLIDARTSSEQVIEITVRCAELDSRRLCLLLDLFIKHFIKIAECCNKYGALNQKSIYIDQAERLSILLSEYGNHKDDVKAYLDKLQALRKRTVRIRSQIDVPETPKRNIDHPIFSSSLNDRYKNSTESLHTFVEITTPGETSEYALDESEVYKRISQSEQRKHVSMAVVHEVESKSSDTESQRNSDEITINNDSEIKQNITSMTRQKKLLNTDDTYI
ncbi:hypothetical protein PV325_007714 [Microctonus aethiopoides]|nr:hypothetical protein PV325_007714 [Microctonus aethiopoides]